jgi:type I restriction-modification system DNA methylase subunit
VGSIPIHPRQFWSRLKEGDNLGKALNDAMAAIEEENPALKGVLPRTYQSLTNDTLVTSAPLGKCMASVCLGELSTRSFTPA